MPTLLLIQWVLLFEVLLIVGMAVFTVLSFQRRRSHDHFLSNERANLKAALQKILAEARPFVTTELPPRHLEINILIPVLEELDRTETSAAWRSMKAVAYHSVFGNWARTQSASRRASKRNWAARCFSLYAEIADEIHILKLIKDDIPLVRLKGVYCALKLETAAAIYSVIERVSAESRLARTLYLDGLMSHPVAVKPLIVPLLNSSQNPGVRQVCYELMSRLEIPVQLSVIVSDLKSDDLELRLAATRALSTLPDEGCESMLAAMLKDTEWEVRAIAARSLGYRRGTGQIPQLSAGLSDRQWWVRINSALALARLGATGQAELHRHLKNEDKFARDAAVYALNIPHETA